MAGDRRKRAYGVSCVACRQKKISCDRQRPRCSGCKDTSEECRIPVAARPLRRAQAISVASRSTASDDASIGPEQTITQLTERMRRMEERMEWMEDSMGLDSSSPRGQAENQTSTPASTGGSEFEGAKYRLTVDGSGDVVYHGLTGWSQGPNVTSPAALPGSVSIQSSGMADPAFSPLFQALATSKHISVAPKLGDALLEAYFCYQVFNIIQRSAFLRDMALGGPLFSEFLLMCMLAKEYLSKELEGPSRITTIQGLLLLSGRECALGSISQGWNHAGLAFRMIHDLGIHLAPDKVAGLSELSFEEQATRDRLFWVAFIWDKSISLAMGREPTFPPRVGRDPSSMADFDDDEGPWTAFFVNPLNCPASLVNYVYQPKRRVAAFRFLARLCLILHDIIIELYSSESRLEARRRRSFINKAQKRLRDLWSVVPDHMKFHIEAPSPPPWIFMLQMLYHATSILLYRLIIDQAELPQATGNVGICLENSITANQMAVNYTQTFGERMSYVAIYSSFVAASFDVVLLESSALDIQLSALERMRTWLRIMEKSAEQVPSIRESVHHVSTTAWNIISKNHDLSLSEPGQWIISLHSRQLPYIEPLVGNDNDIAHTHYDLSNGVGAFDFFDLFAPGNGVDGSSMHLGS